MVLKVTNFKFEIPGLRTTIVNGQVKSGECLMISGPSGSGKTTFLKSLAGLRGKTGGEVLIENSSTSELKSGPRDFGMIFQGGALWEHMSVGENILWGFHRFKQSNKNLAQKTIEERLGFFNLDGAYEKFPAQLSGGEKARVAILRTMMVDFKIYLLDEPFNGLDEKMKEKAIDFIRLRLDETNAPALMVAHERNRLATREAIWNVSGSCLDF
jgi:ABC-type Fe3+/spermidine/putrescine transport system ATPase subunit